MKKKNDYKFTPDELYTEIRKYHQYCEEQMDVFPDESGLLNKLDIDDEEYERLKADPDYEKPLRWARRRRESWLCRAAVDNKKSQGCKMLLAQPQNGGYTDKPTEKKEKKFVVTLGGFEGFKKKEDGATNDK